MLPIPSNPLSNRWLPAAAIVLVGLSIVLAPWLVWQAKAKTPRGVLIVDKTVPFKAYREHAVFTWLLHNLKISRKDGGFLNERDYVGYDPETREGRDLKQSDFLGIDTAFIADTYGVYTLDYEKPGDIAALERSEKIHGGFTSDEVSLLDDLLARGGTIIAEFNTFASPTEDAPREGLERLFGARWTRWAGRYWTDMQDAAEVPMWVGRAYERRYGIPMTVRGPAFVLIRDDVDIVVLQPGIHVSPEVLSLLRTQQAPDLSGLPTEAHPLYWLDILENQDAEIVYQYVFSVTDEGRSLMSAHGIPERFPAMLRKRDPRNGGVSYYFAGDFIDTKTALGDPEYSGLLLSRKWLRGRSRDNGEATLWGWYLPVVEHLLLGSRE